MKTLLFYIRTNRIPRFVRMPEVPESPEVPRKDIETIQKEISELVRRALIQTGDLQAVEEKLKDLVEKSSKSIPPSETSS